MAKQRPSFIPYQQRFEKPSPEEIPEISDEVQADSLSLEETPLLDISPVETFLSKRTEVKTKVHSKLMAGPYSLEKTGIVHSNTPVTLISLSLDKKWGRVQGVLDKSLSGWIETSKLTEK